MNRLLALLVAAVSLAPLGCITREVKEGLVERRDLVVFLRSHARGFQTIEQGFQHPVRISPQRLSHILGAIDIRGREEQLAGIRTAFEPTQVPEIAQALSEALAKASPDQEVAVTLVRKQMQHFLFNRKFLTNFVAYVRDDLLYLHFSLVDRQQEDRAKKTSLPEPRVNLNPMRFKVIATQGMYEEGNYAVSVEWKDPIFAQPLRKLDEERGRRERTILMEEPDLPQSRRRNPLPADLLPYLTPDQLRQLADIEEARAQGRMTEGHYRRERERILQEAHEAKEDAATSR